MSWKSSEANPLGPALWILGLGLLVLAGVGGAVAADWDADLDPTTIVTADEGADVRQILRSIASNIGYGLQMSPDVQGRANVHVETVPVARALDALLTPLGLGYEIDDGVLVVARLGLVTRWFSFNYPVTAREGRGEFQVDAGRQDDQSSASGGGASENGNQNRSGVSSRAVMEIWPELMSAMQTLVFRDAHVVSGAGEEEQERLSLNLSDAAGRSLVVNPMAALVMVTAERERAESVAQLLAHFKTSLHRQVAVEVRIMEVYLDEDTQTGINWNLFAGESEHADLTTFNESDNIGDEFFQFVVDSGDIRGILQAISTSGDLRTVSTPRVTTLNNQKAVVRVVTEDVYFEAQVEPAVVSNGVGTEAVVSYTPRTVPVGVMLDVTPQVGDDQVITLNVHPTITDIVGVVESPNQDSAPILTIRELDTVGKVRHGETLVIAGLISERKQYTRTGVPILKDLPLLGHLFGKVRDRKVNIELVMMLTPLLLDSGTADPLADDVRGRLEARLGLTTP